MHKKILALIATVALLLSAFPTPVFATGESSLTLNLSTTKVISSAPRTDYLLINGTIPIVGAKAADYKIKVEGQQAGVIYDQLVASGNNFHFYLPTNLAPQDVTVTAYSAGREVAKATIAVRYNVAISPKQLQFSYSGKQNPVLITGKVTNNKGEPVPNASVILVSANGATNSYFTGIKTDREGEFGVAVLEWLAAEALELRIGSDVASAVTHIQGEVTPQQATLEVSPQKAVRTVVQTNFDVSGSGFAAAVADVGFTMLLDGQPVSDMAVTLPQSVRTDAHGNLATNFKWTPQQAGTYTLIASTGNYRASSTIVVTNPTSYNLINSAQLETLAVGTNEFAIGHGGIHLVHYLSSTNFTNDFVYTVYIDGKPAQDLNTRQDFARLAVGRIAISADQLGTKTIKIVAHRLADKHAPNAKSVFERTINAQVNGWDVSLNPAEITVNKAQAFTLTVKDDNGNPINNARIDIEGYAPYTPGAANVQNGSYSFKDVTMTSVGPKSIEVYQGAQLMAQLQLNVVGQPVYHVTADVATLLQSQGEAVKLTVTRNGAPVTPSRVHWVYADGSFDTASPMPLEPGLSQVSIKAAQAGPLLVRVENADGTLCGETKLDVVAPQFVLLDPGAANLTNNFKTRVRFQVVDPRTQSVLTDNLEVVPSYLSQVALYDSSGSALGSTILGATEHVLTVLPRATSPEREAAAADNAQVAVAFKLNNALVDGAFVVKEATLTSNPDRILIGAKNNLTLTYLDANSAPIVGKPIVADGANLGKTDAKGQVVYPVSVVTAAAVNVQAHTDVEQARVQLSIRLAFDNQAPRLTYKVVDNKATFVITDDLRISRININGEEKDFWPGPTYEFTTILQPGVNRVHVKAQDTNNNVLDEAVRIDYAPKPEAIVLRGNQVRRHGDVLFVQARQLEELGARFVWRSSARTATFSLGKAKVEISIGSMIARVNGAPVALPAAAFVVDGRTYIPMRFVSETLGWKVHWSAGDVITITVE